jgi:transcription antitermination factor NusG
LHHDSAEIGDFTLVREDLVNSAILDESVTEWATIRTAARWEKKVAELLEMARVPVFLPTLTRTVHYKTRKNVLEIPLFDGYVFFDHARTADLPRRPDHRKYIAQILRTEDPATLKHELASISELMKNNQLIQERVFGAVGDDVTIKSGSFKDYQGTIVRQLPNKRRLVLAVSYLGLSLEVMVDDASVQRV